MQCIPSDYHSDFVFKAVVINALKIQLLGFWFVFFYGTQAEEEEDVEGIEWELEEIQEPLPAYVKDEEPPSYSLSRSVGSPNQQSISVP
jgi:hypothetical protein